MLSVIIYVSCWMFSQMWENQLLSLSPLSSSLPRFSPSPHTNSISVTLATFLLENYPSLLLPRAFASTISILSWMFSSVLPMTGSFSSFRSQLKLSAQTGLLSNYPFYSSQPLHHCPPISLLSRALVLFPLSHSSLSINTSNIWFFAYRLNPSTRM